MIKMMTIKEVAETTRMSAYAVRRGVAAGIYPAIRVCGNPKGKILINIEEFIATLNNMAKENMAVGEMGASIYCDGVRSIAE